MTMKVKQVLELDPGLFSRESFRGLLKNGEVGVVAVNFSEYTYSFDSKAIAAVREEAARQNRSVAVLLGMRGLPESEQDYLDLKFGIKSSSDYLLFPITSSAKEISVMRAEIAKITNRKIPIIAGIRNARAAAQLKTILAAADGVMLDPGMVVPSGLPKEPDAVFSEDLLRKATPGEDFYRGKIWFGNHHRGNKKLTTITQTLLHLADSVEARVIAVGKLELVKQFSSLRPGQTVVLASKDIRELNQAAMLWGVEPVFMKGDLTSMLKAKGLVAGSQRFISALEKSSGTIISVP